MRELITGHCSAAWGSMGEFDDVENYLLHGKYPEGYTKGKSKSAKKMQRQQGWNPPNIIECDSCNHWFHFKCVNCILLSYCFVLLKFVKVYILAIGIEQ